MVRKQGNALMKKKKTKDKSSRPLPRPNQQIPNSMIRPLTAIGRSDVLQKAREFPLHGCWIMEGWGETGITPVIVARAQEPNQIMFAAFIIDLYCLGIKDVYTRADYSLSRFERELPSLCGGAPEPISPELAHEIIYGAVEYAEKLGFQPHPDFKNQMADLMLDPPDTHPRENNVSFGKDGKPLFISGPYDDAIKISTVLNTLKRTCGEGNFHYIAGFDGLP
jgi:hypothetical protein